MAFKYPVSGYEESEKEFQTEAVLKSSSVYWFYHIFRLTFQMKERGYYFTTNSCLPISAEATEP